MKYLIILTALALGACSSTKYDYKLEDIPKQPNTELIVEKVVQPMSRNQVINAVNECEGNGLRPVLITTKQKINGYTVDVTVDVTCAPRFSRRDF